MRWTTHDHEQFNDEQAADRQAYQPRCLWYRGIIPNGLSVGMCAAKPSEAVQASSGQAKHNHFYTDGSGGRTSHLPSYARRMGAAAVQLDTDPQGGLTNLAWQINSVSGNQTVPRAECVGATAALGMAKAGQVGHPVLHVDADYVVKGFPKVHERLSANNADVWATMQQEANQLDVEVLKVKAHTTAEQVASGVVSWDD